MNCLGPQDDMCVLRERRILPPRYPPAFILSPALWGEAPL